MQTHVKVLGVIYLAFGALMLLAALFLAVTARRRGRYRRSNSRTR